MEKEALGLYITGHPMNAYAAEADTWATHNTLDLLDLKREAEVHIAGIAASIKVIVTKAKQQKMAFVQFEDRFGSVELTVFPRTFERAEELLMNPDQPLLVKAKIDELDRSEGIVKLIADEIRSLAEVRETETMRVTFCFDADEATPDAMDKLAGVLQKHPGSARARVRIRTELGSSVEIALPQEFDVRPSAAMMEAAEIAFGKWIATFD
jgi:DNA polymerase-3 subunit alpha